MSNETPPVAPAIEAPPTIELPPDEATSAPEVVAEPVAETPPVVEQLSPQMAQLARRDKGLRERETKLKADLAAYEAASAELAASKGTASDFVKLFQSDIVAAAKRAELTTEQMQAKATELWYAAMGEKAPAEVQANSKFREFQDEIAALKAAREEDKKANEAARIEAQSEGARRTYANSIHTYVTSAFDGAPLVKAFAEENPAGVSEQLFQLGLRHAQANPTAEVLSPADLVKQFEAALEKEMAPLRKRGLLNDPKVTTPSVPEARAPSALTNQRAAAASKSRTATTSDEERLKQAIREYEADLGLR